MHVSEGLLLEKVLYPLREGIRPPAAVAADRFLDRAAEKTQDDVDERETDRDVELGEIHGFVFLSGRVTGRR
jgi:hypothetical protein